MVITGITEKWPCKYLWTKKNGDGTSDFRNVAKMFPNAVVPVAYCKTQQYNDQFRTTMKISEFVKLCESNDSLLLYLKDWHLVQQYPEEMIYELPIFFSEDWINEYWDHMSDIGDTQDDYRFVYIGVKGSFTPLHKDVFRSYSWSTNVSGVKKWYCYII